MQLGMGILCTKSVKIHGFVWFSRYIDKHHTFYDLQLKLRLTFSMINISLEILQNLSHLSHSIHDYCQAPGPGLDQPGPWPD